MNTTFHIMRKNHIIVKFHSEKELVTGMYDAIRGNVNVLSSFDFLFDELKIVNIFDRNERILSANSPLMLKICEQVFRVFVEDAIKQNDRLDSQKAQLVNLGVEPEIGFWHKWKFSELSPPNIMHMVTNTIASADEASDLACRLQDSGCEIVYTGWTRDTGGKGNYLPTFLINGLENVAYFKLAVPDLGVQSVTELKNTNRAIHNALLRLSSYFKKEIKC